MDWPLRSSRHHTACGGRLLITVEGAECSTLDYVQDCRCACMSRPIGPFNYDVMLKGEGKVGDYDTVMTGRVGAS